MIAIAIYSFVCWLMSDKKNAGAGLLDITSILED